MHRLPELLVACVAVLVLFGLAFFIWMDTGPGRRVASKGIYQTTTQEQEKSREPDLSPLSLPPMPPVFIKPLAEAPAGQKKALLPQAPPDGMPRIALVIDDCGLSESGTRAAIALPAAVSLTFLPYGAKTNALAKLAHEHGHDILLHMPMQPVGRADPGPQALTPDLPEAEITRRVNEAFAALPPVLGLNNHMGSLFTADEKAMAPVIKILQQRKLFFLDSVTSPHSIGAASARAAGVPALVRDVFLDDEITEAEVTRELARTEAIARKRGIAIAIGHPHPTTLKILQRWVVEAQQRGFKLVGLQSLLDHSN